MPPDLSRVTLVQLRAFLTVLEAGSFGEAALRLEVTQSSVSYAVAELERALGARLLERGRQGARPTSLGERVASHARAMLAALEAAAQEVELEAGTLRGTLRIASIRSAATVLLPPLMHAFGQGHPQVRFELLNIDRTPEQVDTLVLSGQADLGLASLPTAPELLGWELLRDEFLLLWPDEPRHAAPGWPEVQGRPFIAGAADCARRILPHAQQHGYPLQPAYVVPEDSVMMSMVAHGMGVGVLPALAAQPLPPGVRTWPLPTPLWRSLGVMAAPHAARLPLVAAFLQHLRVACRTLLEA
ncbi:DNA-binding transcriptional LysR family regulator [Deinobacterium chartae]|uniref:DNA-binding transcriptional LysR family regulator n=1 Tax=Deinobacterium chartae TaxID=521158 RepID=A0A841I4Z1_9DEIO|nr:LysR family transcriptional regulator [Deinobacterium chartae]MBB6099498.1 DNA-binding transcriptional LysR family regulator [Deinobacterium chartae]